MAGVWTLAEAEAAGLSRDAVRSRLANGQWQRLRPGTYADGGVVPDAVMRAGSAVLSARTAGRRAVASGRTAARVWGLPLVDDADPATRRWEAGHDDVALNRGRTTAPTLHSRRLTLAAGEIKAVNGVPVLCLPRTLVELALVLRPDALVCAVDHVLHKKLLSRADLDRLLAERTWCAGVTALRTAVGLSDADAESPHESLTRLVLKPVLPGLRSQVRVRGSAGRVVARLDLGDEELRLGVESDGAIYHRGRATQDRRRDTRTGWTIERCSWFETRCEAEQLRARVLAQAATLRAAMRR